MFLINLKRIIKTGFVNFWRNSVVSFASVLIMTLTLVSIGVIMFGGALLDNLLVQLKNKVDMNVYFTLDATEDEIFDFKSTLEKLPDVTEVHYSSREDVLESFKERHQNNHSIVQVLEEFDENPLGASISIKAKEVSQYEGIAKFINDEQSALDTGSISIIESMNYYQNEIAIERLTKIIAGAERIGFATMIFLLIISIIITFNTIRLAIYTSREEIGVMRLIGADNKYIRGPFVIEGIMYGIFSAITALLILYPVALWLGNATVNFFGGINILDYYYEQFWYVSSFILGVGIMLGILSSYMAVKKYLYK